MGEMAFGRDLSMPHPADCITRDDRGTTITFTWRSRCGASSSSLTLNISGTSQAEIDGAQERARQFGWPGHRGDRWSYFKDDMRSLWKRIDAALKQGVEG